jgi:glucose 1-dehydrogenase
MRVLVTGASRGIGRAICLRLARDAAENGGELKLAACGASHGDELESLAGEVRDLGAECLPLLGDLADAGVPARLVGQARNAFGGLDAVVSNAGVAKPTGLLDLSPETWDNVFAINTRATWLLATAAHGALKQSRGALITIASMSGVEPQPGLGAYSATKAAVIMLTRQIAQEWAADGIRANAVSPGLVLTPMTEEAYSDADFRARREAMVPARRISDPERDLAGVVAFLLGPDAGYITGQNILVDGGLTDAILSVLPARKT